MSLHETRLAAGRIWPEFQTKRPHYRLHVDLQDAKPLWWVTRGRESTGGYYTPAAAINAVTKRLWNHT